MKLNSEKKEVTQFGGGESNRFAIEASNKMFKLLSDGLYANKIQAVIREVSCNAVDAHIQAGTPDKPIMVTLPSALNLEFVVKDEGVGFNHFSLDINL